MPLPRPQILHYSEWLQRERGLRFDPARHDGHDALCPVAVLDRFRQVERAVLMACDGYTWNGVSHDGMALLRRLADELPTVRTLSGKKMEPPVRKLLLGTPADQVFKRDAMANGDPVDWFVGFARDRAMSQAEAAR